MQYFNLKKRSVKQLLLAPLMALASAAVLFMSPLTANANLIVIGSKDIQAQHLSADQLSTIYSGKGASLSSGETLTPVDQDENSGQYAQFYQNVLNEDPTEVSSSRSQAMFSGVSSSPQQVSGDMSAIAAVENNTKTIAYVDSSSLGAQIANVKILYGVAPTSQASSLQKNTTQNTQSTNPKFHQATDAELRQKLYQELAAAKLQQMKYEQLNATHQPSVMHEVNQTTSTSQDSLWSTMRANFTLGDYSHNPEVKAQLAWYMKNKWVVNMIFKESEPYISYIYQKTQQKHLPAEFALLPMVESGYVPFAKSSAGAAGLWQLMPSMADHNKSLPMNWWFDGRLDVIDSTNVALSYLQALHARLGSWSLAAAAYNAGGGTIAKAMEENLKSGKPADYWDLPLSEETKHYYPKLLALSEIVKHPSKYGFKLPKLSSAPAITSIPLYAQIDRAEAAALSGVSLHTLHWLNPGMRRWATSPSAATHLVIPSKNESVFKTNLVQMGRHPGLSWHYYRVKDTQLVAELASKYHTSINLLKRVNDIQGDTLASGQSLLVPVYAGSTFSRFTQQHTADDQFSSMLSHLRQVQRKAPKMLADNSVASDPAVIAAQRVNASDLLGNLHNGTSSAQQTVKSTAATQGDDPNNQTLKGLMQDLSNS